MSWSGGDWICNVCQNVNFKKREACHRCSYPKYGGPDPSTYSYNKTEVLAGDWYCNAVSCGAHNYASRPNCFRCGAFKSVYPGDYGAYMMGSDQYGSDASIPPGWKSGDWICHYFPAFDFRRNTFNLSGSECHRHRLGNNSIIKSKRKLDR